MRLPFVSWDQPFSVAVSTGKGCKKRRSGTGTPWSKRIFTQRRVLRGLRRFIPRRLRLGRAQRRGTTPKIRPQRLRLPGFQTKPGRELSFPEKHRTHRPFEGFAQRFCTGARSSQKHNTEGGIIFKQKPAVLTNASAASINFLIPPSTRLNPASAIVEVLRCVSLRS